jgi:hypothetical protein
MRKTRDRNQVGECSSACRFNAHLVYPRHSIQAMQHDEDVLKTGRAQYANDPHWLIAASHVIAVEFATIAAANRYWNTTPGPR